MSTSKSSVGVTATSFLKCGQLVAALKEQLPAAHTLKLASASASLAGEQLIDFAKDCDILLVGREVLSPSIITKLPRLRAVVKYGVGLDNLSLTSLKERGIEVYCEGGVNAYSVAEQTMGMMIGLTRRLSFNSHLMRSQVWQKDGGVGLKSRHLVIVGCGAVGSELLPLALAFGMGVTIVDILPKPEICSAYGVAQKPLHEALRLADVVSLHVPLTPKTRLFMGKEQLSLLKPEAFLINTARGEIWDLEAVEMALRQGRLAGAAADVFVEEPFLGQPILELPEFLATPHTCGNSVEAVRAMGEAALRGVLALTGG